MITSGEDVARLKQRERDRALAVQQELQKQKDDEKNARAAEVAHQANSEV